MDLRGYLWDDSSLQRLRDCGKVSVMPGGTVGLRITGRPGPGAVAGYAGLSTCSSVWACPCCAAKIAHGRAEDLGQVLTWATKEGHTVCLITLTLRHHIGHRLSDSWSAACKAWRNTVSGRRWEKLVARYGVLGHCRAFEVTYGENGWHPHIHAVLVLDGPVSADMVRMLGERMYEVWEKGLASKGYTAIRDTVDGKSLGLDIRVSTEATEDRLAEYFVKQLAVEATHGHAKQGRKRGRTPFQIAADFFATGDLADLDLWHEWEQASRGRRQLTWSRNLREMAGLAAQEATDEELAAEEAGGEDLVQLEADTWRAIRRTAWELLDVAEKEGLTGAERWLRVRGLAYGVITLAGVGVVPP